MDRLLQILSDGEYHSGEELGKSLGISRTAIWKQMQKIEALGLLVESQKGCGYRIRGGLDLLVQELIRNELSVTAQTLLTKLDLQSSVSSTNELAKQQAENGDASGLVIIAEQQVSGRGRRGRQWVSPYGCNLYLSLVWGFEGGVQAIEGLSLAIGVAVLRGLKRCGAEGVVELKWPNDLLWQQKKAGGILLEVIGDPSGFCQVVIGIGLNVGMHDHSSSAIDQDWTNIDELLSADVGRSELAGIIVDEVLLLLGKYHLEGFAGYRDEWLQHDAYAGKPVKLLMINRSIEGIARGVDDSGALKFEVNGQVQIVSGGEISLRAAK
jgi:BirA family transcriptional regulator, biotin operon repressor / biotin---[acetyl-CoA-carboxylase] ligase